MLGRLLADVLSSRRKTSSNPLAEYFFNNPGRPIDKWRHYFDIYHRHFERFRGRSPVVLEIGVFQGGSLEMWRSYFGPGARIVGIDVDPACERFASESIDIVIGDQADRGFLAGLRSRYPRVDIVLDDGGHRMHQQITSFEELYPHIQPYGVYLCEDLHTSYIPAFGGGYRREGTFIEYAKGLIDRLHAWYEDAGLQVDELTRSTFSLSFYDSVLVAEKRPIEQPHTVQSGRPSP